MKLSRIFLTVSSFAIALLGGVVLSTSSAHAAESLPALINTAVAKEATVDVLTTEDRIAILKEIITSSQDEIATLTGKLKDLQLDEQWGTARNHFINTLATSSDHYSKLSEQLNQKDASLEEVKTIAKDLKDWREATYTPQLKEVGNLILIFQTESVRTIIEARDTKISNDIKKLDRQKLVNTDALKKYLSQAEKSIKNAKDLNDNAKDLYYTTSVAPLQPKDATKTPEVQIELQKDQKDPSAVVSPSPKATGEQSKTMADKQDAVRDLAKDSLKELKTAYELFFKMNDRIRK